ncbi:MAG: 6-phosphogluconolactonase [Acidobacteria bacterium 13_1_40CM_3_55_6]|nr:MAG: 6-phosphogluconolactonase [Acidobacteria bacterium 13_1_40CM_3_55_6]
MSTSEARPRVQVFDDAEAVARSAAERFVELGQAAIDARGCFSVGLAGGSTPKRTYELLASEAYREQLNWSKVHIFFGDERCVPPDHSESNYRMANEALISRVSIPPPNVHRINGLGDAVANASLYEDELRTFFNPASWPRFDLVLLGMGDDGHTASLFPGTKALVEPRAWVVANWVEKFGTFRITLTAPAINHAANIAFLVTGATKAERLLEVLRGALDPEKLPSQLIQPLDGSLFWLVDKAAAGRL